MHIGDGRDNKKDADEVMRLLVKGPRKIIHTWYNIAF
jgi:hypothetical protein